MKENRRNYGLSACGLTLLLVGCAAERKLEHQHFDLMMSWLAGKWDNGQQVEAEIAAALPEFDRHLHYAMHYVPLQTPGMDGQVFAIRSFNEGGFDGPLTRVALHRFRWLDSSQEIEHEFLFLLDPGEFGDLKSSLDSLATLGENDVRVNPKCRMYWRWLGDHFDGRTRKGQCITSSYTPTSILVEGHGVLRADELLRHDMNFELSGQVRPRQGGASPERFRKISSG